MFVISAILLKALRLIDGRGIDDWRKRMKLYGPKAIGIAFAMSAVSAFATTPTIGVASASGSFTVNSAQVSGNANLFDGSQVRTDKAASQLFLQDGASVLLATNTAATIYKDKLVLSEGAARIDNMSKLNVEAAGFRVVPDDATSQAAVRMNDGTVEVASMSGAVKVFNKEGAMLTHIGAGTASAFKPGGQSGASTGGGMSGIHGTSVALFASVIASFAGLGLAAAAYARSGSSSR